MDAQVYAARANGDDKRQRAKDQQSAGGRPDLARGDDHRQGEVEVVKSSEIEGEVLDKEQVRSSIARRLGLDIGALASVDRNVEGVVEMMLDATQGYDQRLTKERLFGWHAALFPTGHSGMTEITVGAWRTDKSGPMQVVSGPTIPNLSRSEVDRAHG